MNDAEERKALEAAGMRITTIGEFLDRTPEEDELIELQLAVSIAARKAKQPSKVKKKAVTASVHASAAFSLSVKKGVSRQVLRA
jgi:hypothetical protein